MTGVQTCALPISKQATLIPAACFVLIAITCKLRWRGLLLLLILQSLVSGLLLAPVVFSVSETRENLKQAWQV